MWYNNDGLVIRSYKVVRGGITLSVPYNWNQGKLCFPGFSDEIDDDKDMLDLMEQIASEYHVPLGAVIWLVRLFLVVLPCLTSLYSQMSSFL